MGCRDSRNATNECYCCGMRVWQLFNSFSSGPLAKASNWWTFLGPLVPGAVLAWPFSAMKPIMDLGWGAVVLASVAAGCVVSLVASASLVAWRRFKPIEALLPSPAAEPEITLRTEPSAEETRAREAALTKEAARERAIFLLLEFAKEQILMAMVAATLRDAPRYLLEGPHEAETRPDWLDIGEQKIGEEWLRERTIILNKHRRDMLVTFHSTRLGMDMRHIDQSTSVEVGHNLRQEDAGREMPHVNLLKLQDYEVASRAYDELLSYLRRVERDQISMHRSIQSQISDVSEFFSRKR